jgi:hypothetical protein
VHPHTKLACVLAIAVTFVSVPARAQFDAGQMAQFAPMLEQMAPMMRQMGPMMQGMPRMQGKLSQKRTRQMMQMAGPMMAGLMAGGGDPFGGLGGMMSGMSGLYGR